MKCLTKWKHQDIYPNKIVFSHKATFHLRGKFYRHNLRIWGRENPHNIVEYVWDSPKLNFCFVSSVKVYGPFFFAEPNVTVISYLDMFENYLMPQLQQDMGRNFIFQRWGTSALAWRVALWLLGLDVVER